MILAQEFDYSIKSHEISKLQKDESLRLELTFSKEEADILEQAKALMSHQNPENSWKDLIVLLAKRELKKRLGSKAMRSSKDPMAKEIQSVAEPGSVEKEDLKRNRLEISELANTKSIDSQQRNATPLRSSTPSNHRNSNKRKYISIQIKRELLKKAQYQCEFVDTMTQKRCTSKYFLESEHQIPLARGGTDQPENLRIFCRSHNAFTAKEWGIRRSFSAAPLPGVRLFLWNSPMSF
jgi:hypothetical protein